MSKTMHTHGAHVRWMIRRDMPEVMGLEAEAGNVWTEEDYLSHLRQRQIIGMTAEGPGGQVLGCMVYRLHPQALEVLRLVAPILKVLEVMTERLVSKLSSHRRTRIALPVAETNLDGLKMLRSLGWRAESITREESGPDTINMAYEVAQDPDATYAPTQEEIDELEQRPGIAANRIAEYL